MRKIKFFLASSINEFKNERTKIGDYIQKLNAILVDFDIYIDMLQCEYGTNEIEKSRKQNSYNDFIKTSDFCIMLVGSFVGQYTMEEYNVSLKTSEVRKDFNFSICLLNKDDNLQKQHEFIKKIENDGLSFVTFKKIEDLFYIILMNLKKLNLNIVEKDNKVYLNNNYILDIINN